MRQRFSTVARVFLLFILLNAVQAVAQSSRAALHVPKTAVSVVKENIHGVEIADPYRWLEDQNSPQTRAWIDAQNAYTDSVMARVPDREAARRQVGAMLKIDTANLAIASNGRYFFTRRPAGADQAMLYMRRGLTGKDELLVDPLALNPQHTTSAIINAVAGDGSLMIYSLRQGGEDETTPHLFDVAAHKDLPEKFPRARYSGIAILPDKSGAYVTRLTREGPRVFLHKFGKGSDAETVVFGEGYGPEKIITSGISSDGHYLAVVVSHGAAAIRTEVYVKDLKGDGPMVTIVNDLPAVFMVGGGGGASGPTIGGGKLFLRTNWNAPRWRVLEVDLKNPARDHWREVIPQGESVLEGLSLAGGKLLVTMTRNVVPHLLLYDTTGKLAHEIDPPALGNLSAIRGNWESDELFFTFASFHIPPTIYRYSVATGKQEVWFQSKLPLQADRYEVKQVWYPSKDGTKIPMFLAYAKGLKLDGSHPTLLTGYGGFNLASGGVWALANLRGGSEFGEAWHHAGMLEKKQNVFDDFIAAAEWLIGNKYTSPEHLAIRGRSNGGLLMGAALTQRPDLFAAVSCGYPLLDMVRYQKFLVARYWVPEYGSSDDPAQFKYIYAYSPYHHVKKGGKYPAVLFTTGDSDTRVAPLHARKMTALLQAATGSGKPILLHYDTKAGHAAGAPVSKEIEDFGNEMAFLMWQVKK